MQRAARAPAEPTRWMAATVRAESAYPTCLPKIIRKSEQKRSNTEREKKKDARLEAQEAMQRPNSSRSAVRGTMFSPKYSE